MSYLSYAYESQNAFHVYSLSLVHGFSSVFPPDSLARFPVHRVQDSIP